MNFIIPTPEAIETAIKNGLRDAAKYHICDFLSDLSLWKVSRKDGDRSRSYLVDSELRTCQCEAFRKSGVCKHQYIVDEEIEIRAMEIAQEDGAYLLECSREHLAGFTEECLADTWAGWGA